MPRPNDQSLGAAGAVDPELQNYNDQPVGGAPVTGQKRARSADDDEDDDEKPGRERRKIEIKFIEDKGRRHITFSKRKAGIMKKAYELSVLTGTQVLLLVVSETGLVYTFTTPKLQPIVTKPEGKNLIQACLNAPETAIPLANAPPTPNDEPPTPPTARNTSFSVPSPAVPQHDPQSLAAAHMAGGLMPQAGYAAAGISPEQAAAYQQYLQNQAANAAGSLARMGHPVQHPGAPPHLDYKDMKQ
ncbi:SRF-TF-domain-containing protein [Saitoella complicata NRRL Y-17804]|nr:SRF-TF-domain-containing protein [Saitoella complicata NRRL Y-17804]ODQ56237.1 SRF-TF-domain-containing protein [Saitoella complicata NRRL Y-17804]